VIYLGFICFLAFVLGNKVFICGRRVNVDALLGIFHNVSFHSEHCIKFMFCSEFGNIIVTSMMVWMVDLHLSKGTIFYLYSWWFDLLVLWSLLLIFKNMFCGKQRCFSLESIWFSLVIVVETIFFTPSLWLSYGGVLRLFLYAITDMNYLKVWKTQLDCLLVFGNFHSWSL